MATFAEVRELVESDRIIEARALSDSVTLSAEERDWLCTTTVHAIDDAAYQALYGSPAAWAPTPENRIFLAHELIPRFAPVRQWILERQQRHTLDLGCTDGWSLLNLAPYGVSGVGVDLNAAAVALAAERAARYGFPLAFVCTAIEKFSGGERFDAVMLNEVLEHVQDPLACLRVAVDHLRPGGSVYVTVPATMIPHRPEYAGPWYHLRVFSAEEIQAVCAAAGLAIDGHLLLNTEDPVLGQAYQHRILSARAAGA